MVPFAQTFSLQLPVNVGPIDPSKMFLWPSIDSEFLVFNVKKIVVLWALDYTLVRAVSLRIAHNKIPTCTIYWYCKNLQPKSMQPCLHGNPSAYSLRIVDAFAFQYILKPKYQFSTLRPMTPKWTPKPSRSAFRAKRVPTQCKNLRWKNVHVRVCVL